MEIDLAAIIVDRALQVHRELGLGLYESVYETALAFELEEAGLKVQLQVPIPMKYKGIQFDEGFRADILVNGKVIIELKSMEAVGNVHKKQLLTYLRLSGLKLGLLINFGEELIKNGITRVVIHSVIINCAYNADVVLFFHETAHDSRCFDHRTRAAR